jgi:hypothetical protein
MTTAVLLLCSLAIGADDVTVPLAELGITMPKAVGTIAFEKRTDFDNKALGYSLKFNNQMSLASVIVYDLGNKEIPAGTKSELVAGQLKASINDLMAAQKQPGYLKNVKQMEGELPFSKAVREKFLAAGFTYDVQGGPCKGYILLTARNNNFLKIRITQYIVNGQSNDDEMNDFLVAIAKRLK